MKSALQNFARTEKFCLLVLAALSVAAVLPVLFNGIPYGYDLPHHYQCAMTFYESFLQGDFYPSWSLNRNYGFGGMETRLYPPLSHYSLAVAYYLTGDWHVGSWIVFTLYTFAGALGIYLWAKEYLPARQALFAGCFYALMPYHLNQLYNTFFYAEFVGSAVLPFSFYFVARVCRRGKIADVLGLAVSFAVLILTHLPLTVIGSLCLGIYALTLLDREKLFAQFAKLAAGVSLGLAASSFFWTKVLLERDLMAKTGVYADPWLDYRFHFLLTPVQSFEGELLTRIYETSSFYYDLMFLMTFVLVVGCTIPFLIWTKGRDFKMKGVWILFGLAVFLAIPPSRFVWDALKPLQEVQFPWRWLAVVSLAAPLLAAQYVDQLFAWFKTKNRPLALIIVGCILSFVTYSASQVVRQAPYIETRDVPSYMERTQADIGFTFWWTNWTRKEVFDDKERVSAKDRRAAIQNWTATRREFTLTEGSASEARVAVLYHPNWQAAVDGARAEIRPDANGAVLVPVSNAETTVELHFVEPFAVKTGQWISALTWLGILLLLAAGGRKKRPTGAKACEVSMSPREKSESSPLAKLAAIADSRHRFLLLAGICLLTILPTVLLGVYKGVDLAQHVQFSTTFADALARGDIYPGWAAAENLGYGGVGVRFYPPLTPFLFALAAAVTGSWHLATCVVFFLFAFAGALGVYGWAREFFDSKRQSLLAAAIFAVMPYHLYQIQNGSQFAEFAGTSLLPFAFLFVTRVCRRGNFADVFGLAVSFAVLILTHLPTTVIGSLSLFVYALFSLPKENAAAKLAKLAAGVSLALAASAVYWLKFVTEMEWLRNTKFTGDHFFDYAHNFLLTAEWFGEKQLWFINFIFLTLVLVGAGAFLAARSAGETKKLRAPFAVLFFALAMCTALSKPLWLLIPFLAEVQFPWRWLTIVSAAGALAVAAALGDPGRLSEFLQKYGAAAKGFAAAALIGVLGIYALMWFEFSLNHVTARDYDAYVAEKSAALGGEWFWTSKTREEAFSIGEKVIAGERSVEILTWQPTERVFTVAGGAATDARLATLYYPHWQASVNDVPTAPQVFADGALSISLPAERAQVVIRFEEPPKIIAAGYVSLVTWLIFALAGTILLFKSACRRTTA